MSERSGQAEHPTPYNLSEHPEWKAALLAEAASPAEAAEIEQTFRPDNPIEVINGIELPSDEHRQEFERYYPAFGKVMDRFDPNPQPKAEQEQSPEREAKRTAFLDHWRQQEQEEQGKQYPNRALIAQYRRNDRWLRMTHDRVFSNDRETTPEEAIDWYLHLGALNTMEGAKPYVLRAAEMALKSDPENPRFQHNRMVAASMLLEASVLDERERGTLLSEEQSEIEQRAISILKHVVAAETAAYAESDDPRQLSNLIGANIYLHDLHLREVSRLSAGGNLSGRVEAEKQRLENDLSHLVEVVTLAEARHGATDDIRGLRSEVVTHLLIDHAIVQQNMWGVVQSRKAFRRQDSPRDGLAMKDLPRWRFDMVLTLVGYDDHASPTHEDFGIQIKTFRTAKPGDNSPTLRLETLGREFGERTLRAFRERDDRVISVLLGHLLESPLFAGGAGPQIRELLTV